MADQVVGRAVLEIVTDGKKFTVGMAQAKDQSRAFVQQLRKDGEDAGGVFDKIRSAVDKISFDGLAKQAVASATGFAAATLSIDGFKQGIQAAYEFARSSLQEWSKQEDAYRRLGVALSSAGLAAPSVTEQMIGLGESFAKTTTYSDDLLQEMEVLLVQVGRVAPDQMRAALQASTDLASGLGIDLRTATLLVGKAFAGETGTLARYGVVLDETRVKAEGAGYVIDQLEQKFGGQAAAAVTTLSGQVAQAGKSWDEFKEAIGRAVAPVVVLAVQTMTLAVEKLGGAVRSTYSDESVQQILAMRRALGLTTEQQGQVTAGALKTGAQMQAERTEFNLLKEALDKGAQSAENAATWQGVLMGQALDLGGAFSKNLTPAERAAAVAQDFLAQRTQALDPAIRKAAAAMLAGGGSAGEVASALEKAGLISDKTRAQIEQLAESQKKGAAAAKAFADMQADWAGRLEGLTSGPMTEFLKKTQQYTLFVTPQLVAVKALADANRELSPAVQAAAVEMFQGGLQISEISKRLKDNGFLTEADTVAWERFSAQLEASGVGLSKLIQPLDKLLKQLPQVSLGKVAPSLGQNIEKGLGEVVRTIPQTLGRALEGGGNIDGALRSVGAQIGGKISDGISKSIGGMFGDLLGGGLGSLVTFGFGKLIDGVKKLLGIGTTAVQQAGRDATKQLLDMEAKLVGPNGTYQTLNQLEAKAQELGLTFQDVWGRRGVDGLALLQGRLDLFNQKLQEQAQIFSDIKTKIGDATSALGDFGGVVLPSQRGLIDQLLGTPGLPDELRSSIQGLANDPSWQSLQQTAEKYGISLDALGTKFQQLRANDVAVKLASDFQFLTENGADATAVAEGMKEQIEGVVTASEQFGTTIPENMKPVIQKLIDMGELVDDNGNKITDLSQLNFGPKLESPFDKVANILAQIRDLLAQALPGAIDTAARAADGLAGKFNEAADAAGRISMPGTGAPALPPFPGAPGSPVSGNTGSQPAPPVTSDNGLPDTFDYSNGNPGNFARGGIVPELFKPDLAPLVRYLAAGDVIWPWRPQGTDTVPAMLTPGERVLSVPQNDAFEQGLMRPHISLTLNVNNPVIRNDRDVDRLVDQVGRKLPSWFKQQGRF